MNFFVTGVTGNVGSSILRRLLKDSDTRARVLVRGLDDKEADRRLGELFRLWQLSGNAVSDAARRVIPVRGDMGLPRFGLNGKAWDELVLHCDHLVHAAGVVRMNLPLEEARRHAVGSARNMMELAKAVAATGREVSLAFVSTVGVVGRLHEPLREEWVTRPREFHNTYEQAKADAEDLLREWRRSDKIHLTVHRPSMVVGASDGEILRHQIFYYICEFLSGRHTLGLQPALGGARLDTVPVDYVAAAICWAVTHPESDGRIFNLCSGPDGEVSLATLQEWVRAEMRAWGERLPRIRSLPAPVFLSLVRLLGVFAPAGVRKQLGTLPVLIDYLNSPQVFDGRATRAYLDDKVPGGVPPAEVYLPGIIRQFHV